MERLYSFLIGYAFGLIQTAYIYGKMHGIDIRQHGSGNAGTTNTLRVFGTKAGLIVLVGDIAKCMVALAIVTALFKGSRAASAMPMMYISISCAWVIAPRIPSCPLMISWITNPAYTRREPKDT